MNSSMNAVELHGLKEFFQRNCAKLKGAAKWSLYPTILEGLLLLWGFGMNFINGY